MASRPAFVVYGVAGPRQLVQLAAAELLAALRRLPDDELRALPVLVPNAARGQRLREALTAALGVGAGFELLQPADFLWDWLPRRLGLALADGARARWQLCRALEELPLLAARAAAWDARRLGVSERLHEALLRLAQWDEASVAAWDDGQPSRHDAAYPFLRPAWERWRSGGDPRRRCRELAAAIAGAAELPPLVLAVGTAGLEPPLLRLCAALAQRTRVVVLVFQPAALAWWEELGELTDADPVRSSARRLLAAWGELPQRILRRAEALGAEVDNDPERFPPLAARTLLAGLQRALRLEEPPPAAGSLARDDSVACQRAWTRRAEVEALKHRLVGWLHAHPEIPPHAIAIACPDPEAYAPLLAAVFAAPGEGPPLPIDVPSPAASAEPALALAERLLRFLPGRWEASEVCELLAHPAVAAGWERAGELRARLIAWCERADLRFATDAAHRQALGQPAEPQGTWRHGLQRLAWAACLGSEIEGVAIRDGSLPVPALADWDLASFGELSEFLLPLLDAAPAWREGHPARWWQEEVLRLVRHLRRSAHDAAEAALAQRLAAWCEALEEAGCAEAPWQADAVAAVLGGGRRRALLRGGIAFGTVAELAGSSWQVLALLGFDDRAFPPAEPPNDLDPLLADPPEGLPRASSEARAALLELLASVERHLLLSWVGRDEESGEELPPCPALAELLALLAALTGQPEQALIDDLGLHGARALPPGPWPSAARRAQCAAGPATPPTPLLPASPLPIPAPATVQLADLLAAVKDPPAAYLAALGVELLDEARPPRDHEHLVLDDALHAWRIREQLTTLALDQLASAPDAEPEFAAALARLQALGQLPPGPWGGYAARRACTKARTFARRHGQLWASSAPVTQNLRLALPDGRSLLAELAQRVHPEQGPLVLSLSESQASARACQRAWILGLVWQAAGARGGGLLLAEDRALALPCLEREAALSALGELLAWHERARRQPSPLFPALVEAAAEAAADDDASLLARLRKAWQSAQGPRLAPAEEPSARWLWPPGHEPLWDAAPLRRDCQALGAAAWAAALRQSKAKQPQQETA